ncbi:MAG: hypothetical protein H6672_20895 [Anaerolineaceae bacterium]|nr:hypothetical protein [Anaerolineaceae bacterium]
MDRRNAVDITWRKQAERSVRESEEKFRAPAESAPVAIIAVDKRYHPAGECPHH